MSDRTEQSFIQEARRRQLIDCAIEVIATVGLAAATTTRIAKQARISRGLVTYHFTDRDELIQQVVAEVYQLARTIVGPEVERAAGPRDKMDAFVLASVRFYRDYPRHMLALDAIHRTDRTLAGADRDSWDAHVRELAELCDLLRAGQAAGEFRDFDVPVVATAIRSILDAALVRLADPEADAEALGVELRDLIRAAIEERR